MKNILKRIPALTIIVLTMLLTVNCTKDGPNVNTKTFVDARDNKEYSYVKIGNQTWMAENLAYIPSTGDYWFPNNNSANTETYGVLYSWETAQNIAPEGWHLPSEAEWDELSKFLGDNAEGGGKLKEEGTIHWIDPNAGATNSSGFSALPAGGRFFDNNPFKYFGEYAYFWTTTESVTSFASYYYLYTGDEYLHTSSNAMQFGFSVRCIQD